MRNVAHMLSASKRLCDNRACDGAKTELACVYSKPNLI
jgi:hypothetical protein